MSNEQRRRLDPWEVPLTGTAFSVNVRLLGMATISSSCSEGRSAALAAIPLTPEPTKEGTR